MSRRRKVSLFRWWDEAGTGYTDRQVLKSRTMDGLSGNRLVDICDDQRHRLGSLVRLLGGDDAPLVVCIAGTTGAVPSLLLSPEGLAPALTANTEDGWRVGPLGAPQAQAALRCARCRATFPLSAADLRAAISRSRPGRVQVLTVSTPG